MESKSVLIADNQDLTREGIINVLNRFFENQVNISMVYFRDDLFQKLKENLPDILIIDYALFDFDSVCDLAEIKKISPCTTCLIISENRAYEDIKQVMKLGISHYVLKTSPEEDLVTALKAVVNRRKFIVSDVYDIILQHEKETRSKPITQKLSPGETEIVKLIAKGNTTKEIANIKNLSFHTVNTHRKNIFRKLNINSVSDLVIFAINNGLLDELEYYI